MDATLTLTVNGIERTVTTNPDRPLLDVLREEFHLTGTKYGCGEGQCGACTVLIDGKRTPSCVTPISMADKKTITTIEGLAQGDSLHPVQEAFLEESAMQCGYCTPGMILSAVALLAEKPDPTDEEIVAGMNGNICRCNGYVKITNALRCAAGKMRRQEP
jgi:aerobic-type carbon monoxide dehydrogenase small subunit (CoxS/CutS family)